MTRLLHMLGHCDR
jgi:hypothetical protein